MTLQNINIGNAANDGTGDDLREAFIKVNQNFQYLETFAEQTGGNLGSAGVSIYADTIDGVLKFRRLVEGNNVTLTEFDNSITIDVSIPDSRFSIAGNTGSLLAGNGITYSILGSGATRVNADENTKSINVNSLLKNEEGPQLGANMSAENFSITNVRDLTTQTIVAEISNSTNSAITNLVATNVSLTNLNGLNYQDKLGKYIDNSFDMGNLTGTASSLLEWVILSVGVDFGTFTVPSPITVDLGSL